MKRLIVASLVFLFSMAGPAVATANHHHRHHCRHHRVRRHGRCVRRHRHHRRIHFKAEVDPTFTQAPDNPLEVTYAYSGDATATVNGVTTDLAKAGELPAGILNFYSQQVPGGPLNLYCSMNVGGNISGGGCQIAYNQTGTYQVTTQYIPNGVAGTTQTESETIKPYDTTTTLQATQTACTTTSDSPPGYSYATGPYCTYTVENTAQGPGGDVPSSNIGISVATNESTWDQGMPSNGSCTVYATTDWLLSPDCHWTAGGFGTGTESWSVSASYDGKSGWNTSFAGPVSILP